MAIKGGKVGTIKKLKSSLKKSEGGAGFLTRIQKDDSMIVRFLTEPEEWVEYFEHYNEKLHFYPCSDNCPGCDDGDRASKKYLARALDRGDNKVVPLVLPKSMVSSLMRKYEKYNTIMDRDYELTREGEGRDNTTYDAIPESPSKFKVSRYEDEEPTDMLALLEKQLEMASEANSNDDEDEAPRGKKSSRAGSTKDRGKRRSEPDDDDDDDDDEDIRPVKKSKTASKSASSKKPMKKKRP